MSVSGKSLFLSLSRTQAFLLLAGMLQYEPHLSLFSNEENSMGRSNQGNLPKLLTFIQENLRPKEGEVTCLTSQGYLIEYLQLKYQFLLTPRPGLFFLY